MLVLGGNQVMRKDTELLKLSFENETSSICSKQADIPDMHSKGAIGAYFEEKVLPCNKRQF